MNSRKGFELSINFIVVMILMIVVIGFAITMFTTLIGKAREQVDSVDDVAQRELDAALDTGKPVVVLRNSQTVDRGETARFRMAVRINSSQNHAIHIIPRSNPNFFTINPSSATQVNAQPGQTYYHFFTITPDGAVPGTHIFEVRVCDSMSGCAALNAIFYPVLIYLNVR